MLKVEELQSLAQFRVFNDQELAHLSHILDKKSYPPGQFIFDEEQPAEYLFLLKQGEVSLTKLTQAHQPRSLYQLRAGNYLGNLALLSDVKYSTTAQAVTQAELLALSKSAFDQLAQTNPACALKLLKELVIYLCHLSREWDERYIDMVDYMIDGELYGSRYHPPSEEAQRVETTPGTPFKVQRRKLEHIPLFAQLSKEESAKVVQITQGRTFRAGESIFSEQDIGRELYIIQEGVVKISKQVQKERRVTLSILREGRFFGVLSILEEKRHTGEAVALKDSHILIIEKDDFEQLMQTQPSASLKIMRQICEDVVQLMRKIEEDFHYTTKYVWEFGPFYL